MTLKLTKVKAGALGTIGTFSYNGQVLCFSLQGEDFLPPETYPLIYTYSPKFKRYTYELEVFHHTGIRFHPANLISELNGCIAPCANFELRQNKLYGVNSREMLGHLEDLIRKEKITKLLTE